MKEKVDLILKHNCTVFINRQLIYNYPEQLFADAGVMAIEHADFDGIERLGLVTGGEIVSTFGHPELVKLGRCDLIEEIMIGEDKLLRFSGVPLGEACTLVLQAPLSKFSMKLNVPFTTPFASCLLPSKRHERFTAEVAVKC